MNGEEEDEDFEEIAGERVYYEFPNEMDYDSLAELAQEDVSLDEDGYYEK